MVRAGAVGLRRGDAEELWRAGRPLPWSRPAVHPTIKKGTYGLPPAGQIHCPRTVHPRPPGFLLPLAHRCGR